VVTGAAETTSLGDPRCRKHAFAARAFRRTLNGLSAHAKTARKRAFCPSRRLRHASDISVAGDDPVNEGDPSGLADVGIRTETQCELYSNDKWVPKGSSPGSGYCVSAPQTSALGEVVHFLGEHKAAIAEIAVGVVVVVVVTLATGGIADAVAIGAAGASSEVAEAVAGGAAVGLFGVSFPLDATIALLPVAFVGIGGLVLTGYGIYELFEPSGGSKPTTRGCP
jgi:hypothetical protein